MVKAVDFPFYHLYPDYCLFCKLFILFAGQFFYFIVAARVINGQISINVFLIHFLDRSALNIVSAFFKVLLAKLRLPVFLNIKP